MTSPINDRDHRFGAEFVTGTARASSGRNRTSNRPRVGCVDSPSDPCAARWVRGAQAVKEVCSPEAVGAMMVKRLNEIGL